MPDTSSQPARSRKLGGIPLGDHASPGVYRKPRAFKMKPIPLPTEEAPKSKSRRPSSGQGRGRGWIIALLVLVVLGVGAFFGWQKRAELIALLRPPPPLPAPAFVPGPPPIDTTPLAAPAEGWLWLFDETEWRVAKDEQHEFSGGLLRVRQKMEKPQPAADGAIRARVVVRDQPNPASIFLRSTAEGRYRLALDADGRGVHLLEEADDKTRELGKYRFTKLFPPGSRLTLELRAAADHLTASVNEAAVIETDDTAHKRAGTWGIEADNAWFELVEVPVPKPEEKQMAEAKPAAPPVAEPTPAPAMPATPAPATPPPISETTKWLTGMDAQWQATYQREVLEPFERGVADLKKQYLGQLDGPLAAATQARKMDDAAAFRGELKRIGAGEDVPATDESIVPAALRQIRTGYRAQFAKLDSDRFNKAKTVHARYDGILAQTQAALAQRQRATEAAEIKARRDQLSAAWLKPPAAAAATALASANATPAPIRAALGSTGAPPAVVKMPPRQVVEKLLAMGADVWVSQINPSNPRVSGAVSQVKSVSDIPADKFAINHVEIRRPDAADKAITAADLAILDQLGDVFELGLHGPAVTDSTIEKLRVFRNLRQLTLGGCKITGPGYDVLPTLSGLRELELRNLGSSDSAMKAIGQCHKVQRLMLSDLPLGDDAFLYLTKMTELEEIQLDGLDKITSVSITRLAENHGLKRMSLSGFQITTPTLEAVAKCGALESLTLSGNPLNDEQIVPLAALARLQVLSLSGTKVVGTAFAKWPVRMTLHTLNLSGAPGVNDEAVKGIAAAFPKLDVLDFNLAPLGAKPESFAALSRLRSLRTLRISGEGVSDEIAAEIGKCDSIYYLRIHDAHLSEPGAAALARIAKLRDLSIDKPPVSDAALRSFGKMKALKNLTIAEDAPAETLQKLRDALAGVTVSKRGG